MTSYEVIRNICKNPKCIVDEIKYRFIDLRACAKTIKCSNNQDYNNTIKEVMNLASIKHLKLALQLYDCKVTSEKNIQNPEKEVHKFHIITEYCSAGDLTNYIKLKKIHKHFYTFKELKLIYWDFIEFFAELQNRNLAHRDVKPDNIYVNEKHEFRVGDMGSSKILMMETNENTIVGTEEFLSPEMRRAYNEYKSRRAGIHAECNPYKCDVFSLGLVFLFIVNLNKQNFSTENLEELEKHLFAAIKNVKFPHFHELLGSMLEFDPKIRPNFLQLKLYYEKKFSPTLCCVCIQEDGKPTIQCSNCDLAFHPKCIPTGSCVNCSSQLSDSCNNCQSSHIVTCPSHKLCGLCLNISLNCIDCVGFELSMGRVDDFNFPVNNFQCFSCETTMTPSPGEFFVKCPRCMTTWCKFCKREAHHGLSCVQNFRILTIFCKCKKRITSVFSGIFVHCETCRSSFCLVCLDVSARDHLRCAQVLNK